MVYEALHSAYRHAHARAITIADELHAARLAVAWLEAGEALAEHIARYGPVATARARYLLEDGQLRYRRIVPVEGWRHHAVPLPIAIPVPVPSPSQE